MSEPVKLIVENLSDYATQIGAVYLKCGTSLIEESEWEAFVAGADKPGKEFTKLQITQGLLRVVGRTDDIHPTESTNEDFERWAKVETNKDLLLEAYRALGCDLSLIWRRSVIVNRCAVLGIYMEGVQSCYEDFYHRNPKPGYDIKQRQKKEAKALENVHILNQKREELARRVEEIKQELEMA